MICLHNGLFGLKLMTCLLLPRDIKPANILVQSKAKNPNLKTVHVSKLDIKLCDFGLSRHIHSLSKTVTMTKAGTEIYMPPEAREDDPTIQCTTTFDTYSAGVVLHELLSGSYHEGDICTCTGICRTVVGWRQLNFFHIKYFCLLLRRN